MVLCVPALISRMAKYFLKFGKNAFYQFSSFVNCILMRKIRIAPSNNAKWNIIELSVAAQSSLPWLFLYPTNTGLLNTNFVIIINIVHYDGRRYRTAKHWKDGGDF